MLPPVRVLTAVRSTNSMSARPSERQHLREHRLAVQCTGTGPADKHLSSIREISTRFRPGGPVGVLQSSSPFASSSPLTASAFSGSLHSRVAVPAGRQRMVRYPDIARAARGAAACGGPLLLLLEVDKKASGT